MPETKHAPSEIPPAEAAEVESANKISEAESTEAPPNNTAANTAAKTGTRSDKADEPRPEGETQPAEPPENDETAKPEADIRKRRRERRAPVSQAVVRIRLHLRSRHAQRVFRRSYTTAARALYTLSVMLRVYATQTEAEHVGAVADGMLDAVREDLAGEIARMEKLIADQGIDLGAVEYTEPQEFEAAISTPKAGQYLGLIREMDRFIALVDLLWLSGVYTDSQYSAGSYQWQRRLVKLANRLRNLAQHAMALARREDGAERSLAELLASDTEAHAEGEEGSATDTESQASRELETDSGSESDAQSDPDTVGPEAG